MKKIRVLALFLVLVALFGTVAMAADLENDRVAFDVVEGLNVALAFGQNSDNTINEEKVVVTLKSSALTLNEQVLIVMVKCDANGDPLVSEGNIYYIDQKAVTTAGEISFEVYPSKMVNSAICVTGVNDGLLKAVLVNGKLALGDVNGKDGVDISDVALLLRYVVGLVEETELHVSVADVNGKDGIDISDVALLLRVVVGLEEL